MTEKPSNIVQMKPKRRNPKPQKKEPPPETKSRRGPKTTYTPEKGEILCSHVAAGVPLHQIIQLPDMPNALDTVYRWLRTYPEMAESYARARECRADARSDRIDEIVSLVLAGELDATAARTAIDALKWLMAKENARRYGDKLEIESTGTVRALVTAVDARREILDLGLDPAALIPQLDMTAPPDVDN